MRTITMHRLQDLVRLHRLGNGAREVARLLEMSPNTERDYRLALIDAGLLEGDPSQLPELGILRAAIEEPTRRAADSRCAAMRLRHR
jgi:hypothetical protein